MSEAVVVSAAIDAYAADHHFSAATRARWHSCEIDGRRALLRVAQRLRLGENQFRDIFDQAESIARRRDCTVAEILDGDELAGVLASAASRNQVLHQLKLVLRRMRYPQRSMVEGRLTELVRGLSLPRDVTWGFPAELEGAYVTVQLRAESAAALRRKLSELCARAGEPAIDEMFRLMEGEW